MGELWGMGGHVEMTAILVWGPAGPSLIATCPPRPVPHTSDRLIEVAGLWASQLVLEPWGGTQDSARERWIPPDSVTEGVDQGQAGFSRFQLFSSSSLSLNTSCAPVSTLNRNKPICCRYKPVSHLQNTQSFSLLWGKPGTRACGCQAGSGVGGAPGWDLTGSPCLRSPACAVLVCSQHVLLEQHLVQPGCADESARGLLLPVQRRARRYCCCDVGEAGASSLGPGRMCTNVGSPLPTSDKLRLKLLVLNLT